MEAARTEVTTLTLTTLTILTYVPVTTLRRIFVLFRKKTMTHIYDSTRMTAPRGLSSIVDPVIPSQCPSLPHRIAQKARNHQEAGWRILLPQLDGRAPHRQPRQPTRATRSHLLIYLFLVLLVQGSLLHHLRQVNNLSHFL